MATDRISAVREFNRFWSRAIGVLDAGLLGSPYSLTEARVIFELAQREATDMAELRRDLGLDAGYLSRIMGRLKNDGLAVSDKSAVDGRRQVVRLSAAGRDMFALLDQRSAAEVSALLEPLSEADQSRLVGAMSTIATVLGGRPAPGGYVIRPPRPGDLGWVVHRHGAVYGEEYGWDDTFEALVARVVADYAQARDPRQEAAWIAEVDGRPAGCVLCVRADDATAQLRLLLVEPHARGRGIGSRLVDECVRFARRAGYATLTLWTNDVLMAARRIYEAAGFRLVGEAEHHSFGHDLVGQTWRLDLIPSTG